MTTQGLFNYVINKDKKADICDDCSLVAYDGGIEGWDAQVDFMVMMGADVYDHLCTAKEEPSIGIQCDCGCRSR